MKWFFTILFLSLLQLIAVGQECNLTLSGKVVDARDQSALPYTAVIIAEVEGKSGVADSLGHFQISGICKGKYHVELRFIGYEPASVFVDLNESKTLTFKLIRHQELLNEVAVHGEREEMSTLVHNTVGSLKINREGNKDLANILGSISGVSVLKTGTGVSKPIINGVYGNRIAIINNGLIQSAQLWGNDHAPEIDPFVANHISVIKGTAAVEYGAKALGGAILVDPYIMNNDPHLHGSVNYIFESNGIGSTLNAKLEQAAKWASWRVTGTIKHIGDRHTPDYFLSNTGQREQNLAVQLEKRIKKKWILKGYASTFNSNTGILLGGHVENTTDLEEAIGRDIPFNTRDEFSYTIEPPRQEVSHHLLKLETQYLSGTNSIFTFRYGGQINNRKEYDIRRGNRSEIPALSLLLVTNSVDVNYHTVTSNNNQFKFGAQWYYSNNTNDPETGVFPLIPDYLSNKLGVFSIWKKEWDKWFVDAGARYDYQSLEVWAITKSVPREIENNLHHFNTFDLSGGVGTALNKKLQLDLNLGYAQRAPEINELYSFGLHQGISEIEEGDKNLQPEDAYKAVFHLSWKLSPKLIVENSTYLHNFKNYIFLEPQGVRLTIRGAFIVAQYKQTDAQLVGNDLALEYKLNKSLVFNGAYSLVRGNDISNDQFLIYMPSDNIQLNSQYNFKTSKTVENSFIKVSARYVFKQTRYNTEQEILEPPAGYFLLGLDAGVDIHRHKGHWAIGLRIENALNQAYRDYLNRMRYFSDELGININIRLQYSF